MPTCSIRESPPRWLVCRIAFNTKVYKPTNPPGIDRIGQTVVRKTCSSINNDGCCLVHAPGNSKAY